MSIFSEKGIRSAACGLAVFLGGSDKPIQASPGPEEPPKISPYIQLVEKDGGSFFLQNGKPFVSFGICVVEPQEPAPRDPAKGYNGLAQHGGDRPAWVAETVGRLQEWGFNTVGAWSGEDMNRSGLPYTRVLWLGGESGPPDSRLIDVFDPRYEERVVQQAKEQVTPHVEDKNLVGYFINNELPFYGECGWPTDPEKSLWDRYLALPKESPGRRAALDFFRKKYPTLEAAQQDWKISSLEELEPPGPLRAKSQAAFRFKYAWAGEVAERYFALCEQAVRRIDPNHLLLGSRFAGKPPMAVVSALGRHADIVSVNHYQVDGKPDLSMLRNLHALTGKPVLITEFSWRSNDNRSGDSNVKGAEVTVPTQADRAARYRNYVTEVMAEPYLLGVHWFQYFDEPADGRSFDGENSNYGVVDVHNRPYEALVAAMKETNSTVSRQIASRTGQAGSSFDEKAWAELQPIQLDGGTLAAAVSLPLAAVRTKVKTDVGNSGRFEPREGGLALAYASGGGWGLHGDIALPPGLGGAKALKIRFSAPKGHRLRVFLTESGDGPPGQQTYSGRKGADGESFEFSGFEATGDVQEIMIPLEDGSLRAYWGNLRGDRTLSTAGLGTLSLFVFPGQKEGTLVLYEVTFQP